MPALVLHPWAPRGGAREETWTALAMIRRSGLVAVQDVPCRDPGDYTRALSSLWGRGHDLIIVEHDLVPGIAEVAALIRCDHRICAWGYLVHTATTRRRESVVAHSCFDGHQLVPVKAGASFADTFSLGFTMMRREFQSLVPAQLWGGATWEVLADRLYELARERGVRAHLHWPVIQHLHGDPVEADG